MKWVFWLSVLFIAYSYAGYPLWLYLRSRMRAIPVRQEPIFPFVSIVMAVRNEAEILLRKLRNGRQHKCERDKGEIHCDQIRFCTDSIKTKETCVDALN